MFDNTTIKQIIFPPGNDDRLTARLNLSLSSQLRRFVIRCLMSDKLLTILKAAAALEEG